jgi:hypothetical protein
VKTFECDACGQRLMFENVFCLKCRHTLGYLPDAGDLSAFEALGDGQWRALSRAAAGRHYRMCRNYEQENVCNWMVPVEDQDPFCLACRLNRTIPNLNEPENRDRWAWVEAAKRRLLYTLLSVGLPMLDKRFHPARGLAFDLLADTPGQPRVLTGHDEGVITINVAEAQPDVREKMRREMGEKYRTVVGHFRHEIGHYYWNLLIRDTAELSAWRDVFGDERKDYGCAIQSYYETGAPEDWQDHYISPYASSHPWEDWAETWGNYLHIVDTLESARDAGLILKRADCGSDRLRRLPDLGAAECFDDMIDAWLPLTFALNNINRSLGHADVYPFILSERVINKLRFIHELIERSSSASRREECAHAA